jgi:hypothetical protein
MTKQDLSNRSWKSLSAQNKRDRLLVIEVLRRLKKGEKFGTVAEDMGVSKTLVRKHARCYIQDRDLRG